MHFVSDWNVCICSSSFCPVCEACWTCSGERILCAPDTHTVSQKSLCSNRVSAGDDGYGFSLLASAKVMNKLKQYKVKYTRSISITLDALWLKHVGSQCSHLCVSWKVSKAFLMIWGPVNCFPSSFSQLIKCWIAPNLHNWYLCTVQFPHPNPCRWPHTVHSFVFSMWTVSLCLHVSGHASWADNGAFVLC